jgi:hypothetical protein
MAPKRDVNCFPERAAQREAGVAVMDNKAPPCDARLHQRDRERVVRVAKVHQYVRTKFSEKGKRCAKSFDRFAAQHFEGDVLFNAKNIRHIRNGIRALTPGPDYALIGVRLRRDQIFKETRVAAFSKKPRYRVDATKLTSLGNCASVIRGTAHFTPDCQTEPVQLIAT